MDELVAFVRAALDEDERLARRVAGRYTVRNPDRPDNGHPYWPLPSVERNWHFRSEESDSDPDIAAGLDLIKAYNPQRVLAEVQAKRRILDECDSIIYGWTHEETKDYGRDILKALAQPYAGQPGWREEWAI